MIIFFYNNVHSVQGPRSTRGNVLDSKRHHPKQGGNATKTQETTKRESGVNTSEENRNPKPKQEL